MIDNLKGHVIDNDVRTCFQYQVWFEVITNIKMLVLKDPVNFASASGDGKIVIFVLRSLLTHEQNFYPEVKSFTKMEINLVG